MRSGVEARAFDEGGGTLSGFGEPDQEGKVFAPPEFPFEDRSQFPAVASRSSFPTSPTMSQAQATAARKAKPSSP